MVCVSSPIVGLNRSSHSSRLRRRRLALATRTEDAKVAMARKLAVQLYWKMRKEWDYEQVKGFGPHAGRPEHRRGVQ